MDFEVVNRRSAIASVGGLAVHPRFRGRRVGDEAARLFQRHLPLELGLHRLQLEIHGFNERAIARGAGRIRARGRGAAGLPPRRRPGRRRHVRTAARGSRLNRSSRSPTAGAPGHEEDAVQAARHDLSFLSAEAVAA